MAENTAGSHARRAAVILAAGQGTRMKSPLPKVLHRIGGRTMLDRAIDAAFDVGCERVIVVVGNHSPSVRATAEKRVGAENIVVQDPPQGTGHAVNCARAALKDFDGTVIVTYGDSPLMAAKVLEPVLVLAAAADLAVLGFVAEDPGAYGRLVLDGDRLNEIVEAREASKEQFAIKACNSGVLACDRELLFSLLSEVKNENSKHEYYLTDIVGLARARNLQPRVTMAMETEVLGANSQAELAVIERVWQDSARKAFMENGVHMPAPETVFFSYDTQIEPGVTIEPNVVFAEGVSVASGAVIRAFSHLEGAKVGPGALIGPYARLRPGADIGKDAHIGNFVEVKNVTIGEGAKANHLSYLGDGSVGAGSNIGAGTIFCNYDGYFKYKTVIGERAFIGSNSALVAPVTVGDGAMTASGSVITRDVPADALAFGRAQQTDKPGWAKAFRDTKSAEKAASKT
ncbi:MULTISPECIES: bifunctional UDP-N-acetylglucosamine diphosphorylase/glucosamine-1-phosphate N-acetyltransferase GlmU [Asticcacaulis]|uniref:bifunctional UDP-N-acetylglucosamine diphosphorylase/glucosamine-1-phosphate N-acetyltransferase GlmU n=1 Tax=Asticcacaulis TaxID=76890 RepID=UPI001AE2758C|nr:MULTISPECIES: bifunctional UDP-N-acetylglucosamine diphosphorylase/glucosamine-1-phosphate N-acetyltransferase GlmU [Asticcacaulis]MBP2158616.1 bifunctional UDP-N-acetylglucosamine pyrophosphorylase/glucosamine-1-phosphate N-acetyltransferase [Asticcacaulis solisilvae]MDR6799662.1 bifunctional UDP-N-acetylglucosamine pyrophosphorylase/glucosamine-1-phosphate N-acetyltransferase [Asticcacaulis sp. BE141]